MIKMGWIAQPIGDVRLEEQPNDSEPLTPWICQISRLSTLFVGREMSRLGFGPGHFFFLAELFRNEGISQDELSFRVGVDKSNTSRALAKLEKFDFIRREPDPENHRIRRIYLKPRAYTVRDALAKIQTRWNAELLNGLSEKEKANLLSGLKEMARNAAGYFRENRFSDKKQMKEVRQHR